MWSLSKKVMLISRELMSKRDTKRRTDRRQHRRQNRKNCLSNQYVSCQTQVRQTIVTRFKGFFGIGIKIKPGCLVEKPTAI